MKNEKMNVIELISKKEVNTNEKILEETKNIINEYICLKGKKKINLDNIIPILQNKEFAKGNVYTRYAFENINEVFYLDCGDGYRIVTTDEYDENLNILHEYAMKNLERLISPLIRIDKEFNIYIFKYISDSNPSMIINDVFLKKVEKKVGKKFLFAIPENGCLIMAKFMYSWEKVHIDLLQKLMNLSNEGGFISSDIYIYDNGRYSIIRESKDGKSEVSWLLKYREMISTRKYISNSIINYNDMRIEQVTFGKQMDRLMGIINEKDKVSVYNTFVKYIKTKNIKVFELENIKPCNNNKIYDIDNGLVNMYSLDSSCPPYDIYYTENEDKFINDFENYFNNVNK